MAAGYGSSRLRQTPAAGAPVNGSKMAGAPGWVLPYLHREHPVKTVGSTHVNGREHPPPSLGAPVPALGAWAGASATHYGSSMGAPVPLCTTHSGAPITGGE
ncbi:hypothetical protein FB451DRAFT_1175522 [Mycena latifolia]|nr:hypothetical protein FB451DRAFT_1175522 [Mycena latifolia]